MAKDLCDAYFELIRAWRPPVMPSEFNSAQEILQYGDAVRKSSEEIGLPLIGRVIKRRPSDANEVSRLEVLTCLGLYGGRTEAIKEIGDKYYRSTAFGSKGIGGYVLVEESELTPTQKLERDKIISREQEKSKI